MRRIRTIISIVVFSAGALGCNSRDSGQESEATSHAVDQAAFVNRVWSVVESPAGATGELYVFLSTGTLVITAPEGLPSVGRWSWDSAGLTMIEGGLPYRADVPIREDAVLTLRIHKMDQSFDFRFVPAGHAMPDTTRPVEFDPADHVIFADGNEPFWHLQVGDGSALLFTRDEKRVHFKDGEWIQVDAPSWQYEARREREGREEVLQLTITSSLCVDSESGAEYPLHATLVLDGRRMDGCALAGRSRSEPAAE